MCTLDGSSATYLDPEVERWLLGRSPSPDVTHVVHAPSNPMGWSAGKWMEWSPDVLNSEGKLTAKVAKPYWQSGWMSQHDRLVSAMTGMKGRIPLTISGDLHAVGIGKILRSSSLDLEKNPLTTSPLGSHRHVAGWMAFGISRSGSVNSRTSRPAGRGEADRAT